MPTKLDPYALILASALLVAGTRARAQDSKPAKIAEADARKTALAAVPGGRVQSHELEREKGKLIYSYDIKVAGKSGIEEVNVDAITGAIVAHEHEAAAAEAKERKAEAKEKKKP